MYSASDSQLASKLYSVYLIIFILIFVIVAVVVARNREYRAETCVKKQTNNNKYRQQQKHCVVIPLQMRCQEERKERENNKHKPKQKRETLQQLVFVPSTTRWIPFLQCVSDRYKL